MIDRQGDKIVVECDTCDETITSNSNEEWTEFWARAKEEGWRSRKVADEWMHGCSNPKCKP